LSIARKLAGKAPVALRQGKQTVKASSELNLSVGLDFEIRSGALLWSAQDQKEGMGAFLEWRQPNFVGK